MFCPLIVYMHVPEDSKVQGTQAGVKLHLLAVSTILLNYNKKRGHPAFLLYVQKNKNNVDGRDGPPFMCIAAGVSSPHAK